jgi:hypothetical protein
MITFSLGNFSYFVHNNDYKEKINEYENERNAVCPYELKPLYNRAMDECRRNSSTIDLETNFTHICIMIVLFFIFQDSYVIIEKFIGGNTRLFLNSINFVSQLFIFEMFTEAYITQVESIALFQYQQIALNKFILLTTTETFKSTNNLNLTSFLEFTEIFARHNYILGTKVSNYGPFEYNLLFNFVLFCLIGILMISIHKIFILTAQLYNQYKDGVRLDRNVLKYLSVHFVILNFTIIPIILAVNLAGKTNSQIVGTKVIFNEAVYRFHDRDANTNAIIQYLTDVYFKITPSVTFTFISGTVPHLSLQLAAIVLVIWKVGDIVRTVSGWFSGDDHSGDNNEYQPLLNS